MNGRGRAWAGFLAAALVLWPGPGEPWTPSLRVIQDRAYRQGVFLVVDAIVENATPRPVEWAEVSVEFYDYFDALLSLEHTLVRPPRLGPGQRGTLRVATPWTEDVRKIRYRFTWWQEGQQYQNQSEREPPAWR